MAQADVSAEFIAQMRTRIPNYDPKTHLRNGMLRSPSRPEPLLLPDAPELSRRFSAIEGIDVHMVESEGRFTLYAVVFPDGTQGVYAHRTANTPLWLDIDYKGPIPGYQDQNGGEVHLHFHRNGLGGQREDNYRWIKFP